MFGLRGKGMKTKRIKVHCCDYCNKVSKFKGAMISHDRWCQCKECKYYGGHSCKKDYYSYTPQCHGAFGGEPGYISGLPPIDCKDRETRKEIIRDENGLDEYGMPF